MKGYPSAGFSLADWQHSHTDTIRRQRDDSAGFKLGTRDDNHVREYCRQLVASESFDTNPHDRWRAGARGGKQIVKIRVKRDDDGLSLSRGEQDCVIGRGSHAEITNMLC